MKKTSRLDKVFLNKWFVAHGYSSRSGMFWYKCGNGLLRAVGFDNKSNNYEPTYFVQILFSVFDCFALDYGDTLTRKYSENRKNLLLYKDMDEDQFQNNLKCNLDCFENEIIPFLNRIITAEDLLNAVVDNREMFFCEDRKIVRLQAYCNLYLKHYDKAFALFGEYIDYFRTHGACENAYREPLQIVECMKKNPEDAFNVLQANVTKTMGYLKIK